MLTFLCKSLNAFFYFQEERAKALELLKGAEHKQKFNLSDLKVDKTQYFDSQLLNSPFQPSEFSARSTILHNNAPNKTFDCDFDEIMRNSTSSAVRSKYRESMGRLSVFPRTTDMSMRSSVSTSSLPKASGGDFWDNAKIASNSFVGSYCSNMSESFRPAEEMDEMLKSDEMEQEKEFATIPRVQKSNSNESNWEVPNRSGRQPEMSFGQYIASNIATNNIRDIYGNTSPAKKGRVALVELDNLSTPSETSRLNLSNLQKMIRKLSLHFVSTSNKFFYFHRKLRHSELRGAFAQLRQGRTQKSSSARPEWDDQLDQHQQRDGLSEKGDGSHEGGEGKDEKPVGRRAR